MDTLQLKNVVKSLKKTELVFQTNDGRLRVGKSNIRWETIDNAGTPDERIIITPQIQEKDYRVNFSSSTLDKHGATNAQELIDFWESNNFFFDIGSQPIADGRVEFRADLPITIGFPAVGAIFVVEKPTTILLGIYTTFQSGWYMKDTDTGSLNDWRRLNKKFKYTANEFAIVDSTDQSKQGKFDASSITTATTRTYTIPDKNGIIALISDINGGHVGWVDDNGVVRLTDITDKVGIGTINPNASLHIVTTTSNGLNIEGSDTDNIQFGLNATGAGGDFWELISTADGDPTGGGNLRIINVDTSKEITITSVGKFGVGNQAPTADLDVKGNLSTSLTGTVSVTINTAAVTGVGTLFTSELNVGDAILIRSQIFTVLSITDDLNLILDSNHTIGASGEVATKDSNLFNVQNGDAKILLTLDKSGNLDITENLTVTGTVPAKGADTQFQLNDNGILAGTSVIVLTGGGTLIISPNSTAITGVDNGNKFFIRDGSNVDVLFVNTTNNRMSLGDVGGSANIHEKLHIRTSGTSTYTAGAERGMLITDSIGPRIVFEDSGEGVDDKVMAIEYSDETIKFLPFNDIGSTVQLNNILDINRDGNVNVGKGDLTITQGELITGGGRKKSVKTFSTSTSTFALGLAEIYELTSVLGDLTLTISDETIAFGSSSRPLLLTVQDLTGALAAGGFTLTIVPVSGLINGKSSIEITEDFGSIEFLTDGTDIFTTGSTPNSRFQNVLVAQSTAATQGPIATNTNYQIEFGVAQGGAPDPVQLSAAGALTINESGEYHILFLGPVTRTTAGGTAVIGFRVLRNAVQVSGTLSIKLPNGDTEITLNPQFDINLDTGDIVTFEIVRDSSGVNEGELTEVIFNAAGWANSPSAVLMVQKLVRKH